MQLVVQAENAQDLKKQVLALAMEFDSGVLANLGGVEIKAQPEEVEAPKRGRPAKYVVEKEAEVVEAASEAVVEKPVEKPAAKNKAVAKEPVKVTKQQIVAALQDVNAKKGLAAAKEVLQKFNCARLGEVTEGVYPEFLKACQEVLG